METEAIATLLEDTAARSLQRLDDQAMGTFPSIGERGNRFDFGTLCQEFATLADPEHRLNITYPDRAILADHESARLCVHGLADQAAAHAATFIRICVVPSPVETEVLRLIFEFDVRSPAGVDLARLGTMCQMHGIQFRHVIHAEFHRVELLLPNARCEASNIIAPEPAKLRFSA